MAKFEDGREALLLIGRSSTQVRQGYVESFTDLLDEDEREQVVAIRLRALARRPGRRRLGTADHPQGPDHGRQGAAGRVTVDTRPETSDTRILLSGVSCLINDRASREWHGPSAGLL